jgi:type II secretory ATPase GspE/PulE/Tfp pilus assembly ATPase PilB-like protein
VRKICPKCRIEIPVPQEVAENIKSVLGSLMPQRPVKLYKGQGCEACGHTGYLGRVGIFEVLVVSDIIAKQILEHATAQEIETSSKSAGMVTMKQDGYMKVLDGLTTMEEVLRVAQD